MTDTMSIFQSADLFSHILSRRDTNACGSSERKERKRFIHSLKNVVLFVSSPTVRKFLQSKLEKAIFR